MTENEEFEFRARLEKEQGAAPAGPQLDSKGRYVVEPNTEQRRMGLRKNRFKDENLAGNVGGGLLTFGEDMGREATMLGTGMGLPPAAANAMGFAGDAATMFLPIGPAGKAAQVASRPLMDPAAKFVMQSALKPTSKSIVNGDAAKAVDTMLEEGIPATVGGAAKLRQKITELKGEVAQMISQSPANVKLGNAYKELQSTLDEVGKKGIGYEADREAVMKAWNEFKNHPLFGKADEVPIQAADTVKRATQKSVDYTAPVQSATDQAKMAAAKGLRVGMEEAEPAIAPINKKLGEYLTALHQLEPRAAQAANKDLGGLATLAPTAEQTMLMLADRNPWLKSYIARVLYGGKLPAAATQAGTATLMSTQEGR